MNENDERTEYCLFKLKTKQLSILSFLDAKAIKKQKINEDDTFVSSFNETESSSSNIVQVDGISSHGNKVLDMQSQTKIVEICNENVSNDRELYNNKKKPHQCINSVLQYRNNFTAKKKKTKVKLKISNINDKNSKTSMFNKN